MNKKYAYVCSALLMYSFEINFLEAKDQEAFMHSDAQYVPPKFSDQFAFFAEKVAVSIEKSHDLFKIGYNDYFKIYQDSLTDLFYRAAQIIEESIQTEQEEIEQVSEKSPSLKEVVCELHSPNKQKYVIAVAAVAIITASVAYKYRSLSSSQNAAKTKQEIQNLVESVLCNPSVLKENKLLVIVEILIKNGFENIVVCDQHAFEIDNHFKVEINERLAKVTYV